jgi:hypothetical protein
MIALDTNILVRYLLNDAHEQTQPAKALQIVLLSVPIGVGAAKRKIEPFFSGNVLGFPYILPSLHTS